MNRRRFLAVSCTALPLMLAGCSTDQGTGTDTTTTKTTNLSPDPNETSNQTPDPDDPIAIDVNNGRSSSITVTVMLTRHDEQLFHETLSIAADGRKSVNPGIVETGTYELTVSLADGTKEVSSIQVENFDIQQGSNLIVEIDSEILVLIEE